VVSFPVSRARLLRETVKAALVLSSLGLGKAYRTPVRSLYSRARRSGRRPRGEALWLLEAYRAGWGVRPGDFPSRCWCCSRAARL
jgi:hypothetical protein